MKKINSIIALLLTVVMLAGCGGKASDESNPEVTSNSGDADVIEIVSWWDETPVSGDELNDRMVKRQADIEKKYNVKFKFTVLPADEITTRFTAAILAGDTLGDFVNMRHFWAFPEYAQKGFLLNMSDYLDFSDPAFNKDDTERATYDNNVYGFSMNPMSDMLYISTRQFSRRTVLKALIKCMITVSGTGIMFFPLQKSLQAIMFGV